MVKSHSNIFLIGPMGSGKTTIGRVVAQELGLGFHDCDHELEHVTGASVNLIFDVEGEEGFRTRETQQLKELTALNDPHMAKIASLLLSYLSKPEG